MGKGGRYCCCFFFNFPFVFQWTWKHIFCSGCLNLSCFFGCYIEFVFFSQIADLANEDTPQLYAACGRGPRSSMRVLRHGLEVIKTTFQIILFQKNLCVEMWLEWRLVLRKICYFKSSRFPKWLYQSCQVIPMLFGQSRHILKVDLLIQFDIVWFIGEKLLQTSLFSSTACSSSDGMLELTCNLQYILDMSPMWFYYRSS